MIHVFVYLSFSRRMPWNEARPPPFRSIRQLLQSSFDPVWCHIPHTVEPALPNILRMSRSFKLCLKYWYIFKTHCLSLNLSFFGIIKQKLFLVKEKESPTLLLIDFLFVTRFLPVETNCLFPASLESALH